MLMTAADYRESLRRYKPRVFINSDLVGSVADDLRLAPGIAGVGVTYDFAQAPEHAALMTARQGTSGRTVMPRSRRMASASTSVGPFAPSAISFASMR